MNTSEQEFQNQFDEILRLHGHVRAASFAHRHVTQDVKCAVYHECLGIALWFWDRATEAIESFERARDLSILQPATELIYIQCLASTGERRRASRSLRVFLEKHTVPVQSLESLASKLGKVGEYYLALQVCQHLVLRNPASPDAWYGIAFYQERLGCALQTLLTPLRRAVLFSGSICARVHLARVLFQMEEQAEAYVLVRFIPIEAINRLCWANTIFQIAMAQQDFVLAEKVRVRLSKLYECSLDSHPLP